MKNTFHLRSYQPYGKKQLQRYTASTLTKPLCRFSDTLIVERNAVRLHRITKMIYYKISIKSHFFFLCTLFFVLLLSWLDLRLAFLTEIFSVTCFDNNNTVTPTHKNAYAKRGPFIAFDRISTSETINYFDLVLMRNLITIRNQCESIFAIE